MQAQGSTPGQHSPLAISLPPQPQKAPSDTSGTPLLPWRSQARRLRGRGGGAGAGLSLGARRLGVLPFSLLGVGRRRVKHSLVPFHLHDALGIQVQLCKATRRGAVAGARERTPLFPAGRCGSAPAGSPRSEGLGRRGAGEGVRPPASPGRSRGDAALRCRPRPEVPPDPGYLSCSWAGPWRQLSPWCPTSFPLPGAAGGRPRSAPAAAATRRSSSVHAGPGARAEGRGRRGRRQREGGKDGRRGGGGSGAGDGGGGAAPAASLLSRGPRRRWPPTGSLAEPLLPPPPCQSPPPSSPSSFSAGSAGAHAGGERAEKVGGAGERRKHPSAFGTGAWGDSLSPRPILGQPLLPGSRRGRMRGKVALAAAAGGSCSTATVLPCAGVRCHCRDTGLPHCTSSFLGARKGKATICHEKKKLRRQGTFFLTICTTQDDLGATCVEAWTRCSTSRWWSEEPARVSPYTSPPWLWRATYEAPGPLTLSWCSRQRRATTDQSQPERCRTG